MYRRLSWVSPSPFQVPPVHGCVQNMLREPASGRIHPLPAESSRTYVSRAVAQARRFLYPRGDRQKLVYLATEIFGTPRRAASSQLFTRQEVVGPSDLSADPEPPSSLQPLAVSQQKRRPRSSPDVAPAFCLSSGKAQRCPRWVGVAEGEGSKAIGARCCFPHNRNPVPKAS